MRFFYLGFFLLLSIYGLESSNSLGLYSYKPQITLEADAEHYTLHWNPVTYPAYYEVEVINTVPDSSAALPSSQQIVSYRTLRPELHLNRQLPDTAYIRVSAHGLFQHPLGSYSDVLPVALYQHDRQELLRPYVQTHYPRYQPAPTVPTLLWSVVPGAVYYEWELLSQRPENPNGTELSQYQLFSTREVFTNGFIANLEQYAAYPVLYWRVRALDYNGNPIGVFSDAAELAISPQVQQLIKPLTNTGYQTAGQPMPLYPVYSWIPITGALHYEVEVTSQPPENPNGSEPSEYRLSSHRVTNATDCYVEEPLLIPGTYYWRVRAFADNDQPIGVYSDAEAFVVDFKHGHYAATFGDSITHGGGAVSYSPADVEYDFQTYLSFMAMNLGKSGDTAGTMLARFDQDVLPYRPQYLLIMGGSNSLRGGIPAVQVINELAAIRDKCLQHGIRPIFLTLPPINPAAIALVFNEPTAENWRQEFAQVNHFIRQQRYYIDLEPYFTDSKQELPLHYATDGLHMDIEGKKLMAQIINANWDRVTR